MAKRALDLQIYDFSLEDKKRAEKLLEMEKFKAQSNDAAKRTLRQVEIYKGKRTKPSEELGAENINVDVPVFDEGSSQDEADLTADRQILIAGISP